MLKKTSRMTGLFLIMLSLSIVGVSAYVYQQASQTITQTIKEVATIVLKDSDLGQLKEGETASYDKISVPNLGDAISITTQEPNVYLHLNSDLNLLTTHSTYDIVVKYATVPGGSGHTSGNTACTLSIGIPDFSSIDLDVAGSWTFDFEITTGVGSVDADVDTTVNIIVTAESTA